jgi:glutathione synthase/RimK-type ligase-like ATP-grasp enzyme
MILIKFKEILKKMLDKKKNNAYIWYSGATDVTGTKLAEALGISHGRSKPTKQNLIIGWGTKIDQMVSLNKIRTLNHPNQILCNRDKLEALKLMDAAEINVAKFIEAERVIRYIENGADDIKLPLIGRTKYHQGGKGFWLCPTLTHVKSAISEGAKYFQNMIEIKEEYRLHIFNGELIYAVKKSKRSKEDYQEAYVRQELEHQKKLAEKNNNPFDDATARLVLERIARKKTADGADMIIRSNRKGWKFSHIKTVNDDLKTEAILALKALKLDFGAVDCCLDVNGVPYIIEINTGPGLEETPFNAYVAAFKKAITRPTGKPVIVKNTSSTKHALIAKTALMAELVEKADETEAEALKGIFKKMFN